MTPAATAPGKLRKIWHGNDGTDVENAVLYASVVSGRRAPMALSPMRTQHFQVRATL